MNKKQAIREIELMFDNNFYLLALTPLQARFTFKLLWELVFGEKLTSNDLSFIR